MESAQVHKGDVLEWAASYTGPQFHALLCDPPYELGFMGKSWDRSGIAFKSDTWAALARHLHPGAFVMAFASSRGWHRQAVAMEDAGLVIHPTLFGWAFGSGFPKATRIDKPTVSGTEDREAHSAGDFGMKNRCSKCGKPFFSGNPCQCPRPKSDSPWAGHRYGLQALKPALEPVIVAQKPYEGKPVESITRTGAGALNIEAGRIGIDPKEDASQLRTMKRNKREGGDGWGMSTVSEDEPQVVRPEGRWPSNFYLADPEAAARLDEQSGDLKSGRLLPEHGGNRIHQEAGDFPHGSLPLKEYGGDSGGASRFFFNVSAAICEADPVLYTSKAGRWERDAGLEKIPPKKDQIALRNQRCKNCGRSLLDGRREGRCCDSPEYVAGQANEARNLHPTIKPLDLTRYLARLLLPPPDYVPRRLLVPFSGVGSEMIGAMLSGWEEVVGIEMEPEYCSMAEARIAYWREAGNTVLDDAVAAAKHEEIREMKQKGQKGLDDFSGP